MKKKVAIIDYGIGNTLSIQRALKFLKINSIITNKTKIINNCSHLILPGVGSFSSAMSLLHKTKMDIVLKNFAKSGKPLLGICLGMQLLFDASEEFGRFEGLGLIPGVVKKINLKNINTPNVGWFKIQVQKKNRLLKKFNNEYMYFTHSFECLPLSKNTVSSKYQIGKHYINCSVQDKNILGVQFHPEKSYYQGIEILNKFYSLS